MLHCQDLVTTLHNTKDLPEKCRSYSSVMEAVNQKNQKNNSRNNNKQEETDAVDALPQNRIVTPDTSIQDASRRSLVRKQLIRRNTSNRVDRRQDLSTDL